MYIEFKKYKRVFAFGCSFTSYIYPTWADILASEMPHAAYYNFGNCGSGNLFVAARLVEANRRFNFCETDLIMVMYSTSFREDRYIDGNWAGSGHIYNQSYYPMKSFVFPYCQPEGMLLRDLAMVDLSSSYIRSLPCDNLLLNSAPVFTEGLSLNDKEQHRANKIVELYAPLLQSFPPNMLDTEFLGEWVSEISYIGEDGNGVTELHPTPQRYYNYLQKLGINLTDLSKKYIEDTNEKLNRCNDVKIDFPREFSEGSERRNQARRLMF